MQAIRVTEEIGPDEDHLLRTPPLEKVIGTDCPEVKQNRGVVSVERNNPVIEKFLNDVPYLVKQKGTLGLIWDKNLKPENLKYEEGVHFLSTREAVKKTSHASVSFFRDGVTGAKFAIKTLQKGTQFHPEEVTVGLTIQHPNICSVYGIIIAKGLIHILLEHAGLPLYDERAWIAERTERIQSFAKQSFQALEIIHRCGFVHCDIKPDNTMIFRHESNSNEFTVKLIDFGTCQPKGTILPKTAHTTTLYWAPEIWQALDSKNDIICSPAMDVYALALMFYFVHTSLHLLERFANEVLKNLMIKAPQHILVIAFPDKISPDLSAVMNGCLDGDHKNRTSAQQALQEFEAEYVLMRRPTSTMGGENYKDSFNRMCSSISKTARHASNDISTTAFKVLTISQTSIQNSQEKGLCTSSTTGIERRECKPAAKAKKGASLSGNKFNKPSQKVKKCPRPHFKQRKSQVSLETFQAQLVSPDSDLEKGVKLKPDDTDYSYSTLLKNLALIAQEPNQASTPCTYSKNSESSRIMQSVIGDQPAGKALKSAGKPDDLGYVTKWPINQANDTSNKFSGVTPESKISEKCQFNGKNDKSAFASIENSEEDVNLEITNVNNPPAEVQSNTEHYSRVEESNSTKSDVSAHDDMEFLYHTFGDDIFTGADDEIVDNMCAMLDRDEQTESRSSPRSFDMDANTHQAPTVKQGQVAISTEEEPMDADNEGSASVSKINIRSALNLPAVKGKRKRMAESSFNPSCIPGKTVFSQPSHQDITAFQLPNFDQILPERF